MTRKITYRKLQLLLNGGDADLNKWSNGKDGEPTLADVTFYHGMTGKREIVEVTQIPTEKDAVA